MSHRRSERNPASGRDRTRRSCQVVDLPVPPPTRWTGHDDQPSSSCGVRVRRAGRRQRTPVTAVLHGGSDAGRAPPNPQHDVRPAVLYSVRDEFAHQEHGIIDQLIRHDLAVIGEAAPRDRGSREVGRQGEDDHGRDGAAVASCLRSRLDRFASHTCSLPSSYLPFPRPVHPRSLASSPGEYAAVARSAFSDSGAGRAKGQSVGRGVSEGVRCCIR